ncbi:MAG: 50S ribosomal protein L28 [Saprospiraceae bacterium]
MARICELTGKGPITGHSVSHSNHKTNRRFLPNLQKKRFYIPETDEWVTLKVSTQAIRSIDKLGIFQFLKKQEKRGFIEFI